VPELRDALLDELEEDDEDEAVDAAAPLAGAVSALVEWPPALAMSAQATSPAPIAQ
jgi:hypothetical protein